VPIEYVRDQYFEDSAKLPQDLRLSRDTDDSESSEKGGKIQYPAKRSREGQQRVPQTLRDHIEDVRGHHLARFLASDLSVVRETKPDEIEKAVDTIESPVNGLVVDRSIDQKLLDRLVMKGLEYVAAKDFKGIIKRPLTIRLMKMGF
jgi:DNA primase